MSEEVKLVTYRELYKLVDILIDTAARSEDLDNVYDDEGNSMSWEEVADLYGRLKLQAKGEEQ